MKTLWYMFRWENIREAFARCGTMSDLGFHRHGRVRWFFILWIGYAGIDAVNDRERKAGRTW